MAFGVKVKLDVELANASKLRSQIQQAVENATQNKPVKIRHLAVDLGRQEAQRISKQLESAIASQDLTIKIAKIDASKPVANLKKQLTTMLSGLSITGLKDFLGADGVGDSYDKAAAAANRLAEAQENVRRKTEEANAAMKTLKSVQSTLNTVFKSTTSVGDQAKLEAYLNTYRELIAASEAAKNKTGEEQSAEVMRITAATIALKKEVDAQLQAEQAAKKKAAAAKSAEEIAKEAAAEQERAAKKEANVSRQTIQLRQRINTWIQNNSKAYAANKTEIDSLLSMLQNEASISDVALAQIRARFEEINASARESGISGRSFFDTLKAGWAKFGGWSLVTKSMMAVVNTIKDMVSAVKTLDAAMTELKKVTDLSSQSYANFANKAAQTAKRIGASVSDTINATADFSRLGYNIDEAAALAEAALIYKNVGDGIDDISVATESLISTLKAFGIEADNAMSVIDMFNEVGNNFAISSSGIGEALQRSASALAAAGNTIEQSIGLVTAMNSVVQNPESVGTALKTLTMFLRAAKTEAEEAGIETEGMADSVSELRAELKSLTGIDIMIDNDTFKSTYQIIKEIASVWNTLTDVTQSNVLNLIGGKRNANVIASLITNFEDAENAMKSAMNSLGSATAENEKYIDSINGKIAVLKASFEDLSSSIVSSTMAKTLLDVANGIMNVFTWLSKANLLLPTITASVIAIRGAINGFKANDSVRNITSIFAKVSTMDDTGAAGNLAYGAVKTALDGLTSAQKKLAVQQIETAIASSDMSDALKLQATAALKAATSTQTFTGAGKTLSTTIKGISAAFKSWQVWLLVIEAVIWVAQTAINGYNQSVQESIDKAHELSDAYSEARDNYSSNTKTLKSLESEFNKLSAGVDENGNNISLTATEYERYLSIIDQIIDISPSIVSGYDEQGRAILDYKSALTDAIDAQQTYIENQRNIYLGSGKDIFDGTQNEYKQWQKELGKKGEALGDALNGGWFPSGERIDAWRSAITELGLNFGANKTWKTAYDELLGMYEKSDQLLILLRNSGQYTEEELKKVESALAGLAGSATQLTAIEAEQVNYLMEYSKGTEWFSGIPMAAVNEFRAGLTAINDPLLSYSENLKNAEIYGKQFAAAFNTDGAKNLTDMSRGLSDGTTTIEDYNKAVESFRTALGDMGFGAVADMVITYFLSLTDYAAQGSSATDDYTASIVSLSDALSALTKGYDILNKAKEEMDNDGSLSVDTISSIASMLKDGEKITDYLLYENGLIKLNEEAWKSRVESMINGNISGLKSQIGELEDANEILLAQGQINEEDQATIDNNNEKISQLEKELELYQAIYGEIVNGASDPTSLSGMISSLDAIGSKSKGLLNALKDLDDGTAMSAGEVANLSLQYEELFGMSPDYDLTTLEGQKSAIEAIISTYEQEFDAIIDTQIAALEAAKTKEGITEDEIAALDAQISRLTTLKELTIGDIYGEGEETTKQTRRYEELADAIEGASKASKLLTDIQSGEGDTLSMLQTVADMAQQSGQSLNDFFTITGNEIKWDEGAIVDWAGNLVDRLSEIKEISPEVQAYLKGMIAAEIEAATAAERMQKAYSNMQSAAQSRSSFGGYTQITYEDYQSLIETDKRYASAIEYQNGVMVLNSAKHDEITMKILEENKAMALAEKQAILMSEEYQELRRKMDAGILTENEDRQRLLDLETQIRGYDILANEIDNATSAYYRWLNRKGDDGMDRYSQALQAFELINSTLNDKKSEYYGRIGRDEFGVAVDFVIGENVEVNTPEFDRAMNLCKRYLTDGAEGAANFYDDMVSAGLLDATTGSLNSTVAEIANALGVSEEMVRTMIDRINEYQEEANKIDVAEPEVSVDTESTESALDQVITSLESANEYISTISNTPLAISIQDEEKTTTGLTSFKDLLDAIQTNLLTILQNPLSFNISDLAVAVQSIIEHISNIQEAIETANGLELSIDGSGSEASLDSLNDSANIVVTSLTAISNILTAIVASRDGINSTGINITTGRSSALLGSVSSKLSAIISQLAKIKANSNITVRINEITTKTTRTGGLFSGLFGNSSVSGNAAVRGTAMASGGNTLVGELGMETVVDPATNTWYTVGEHGAEFVRLPQNAIVFNHKQTEELFGTGRIDSRGEALATGNAAISLSSIVSGLKNLATKKTSTTAKTTSATQKSSSLSSAVTGAVSGVISTVKNTVSGIITGISSAFKAASDKVTSSGTQRPGGSGGSSGGSSGSGGSGSGSGSKDEKTELEKLKEKYEELNKQTEHLIAHQEFLYKQAEKGLDYSGMDKSLQAQAELYKKIMSDSQAAVAEMIASGADDTSEELQSMEESYWSAYESLYETLDKINDLYVDALNEKIDGIQTAFDNLQTAADEFNKYGGITLDSFQSLLENGVQYMSLLENQNGQYIINTEGIQKLIAAQKEQLAVESAISYLKQLQTALADGEVNAVANLVNLTNQLSSTTWDAVYAQAALLRANLSEEQYAKVIANIDALRAISSAVITDITKQLDDSDTDRKKNVDDQQSALEEILKLTEDLVKAEAEDRIEAIEDEIDAYKKIIDLKKESLKASKDENDYAKSVAEKTKEIAKLQARIDQLKLDDSREARAERASLEEQLANLQGELGDLQNDRAYEIQTDALDKAAEDFEDARQKEIDAIENNISSAEKLYQAAMARLESGWDTLYQELIDWNTEAGSSLNSEITENWLKAAEAVKLYGSYVQAVAGVKAEQEASGNTTTSSNTIVATGTPTVIPPREETPIQTPSIPETDSKPEPEPEPIKRVKVVSGRWNVRTGPSTKNKILGVVGEGTLLDYRGQTSGDWYAVSYNGNDAWINNGGSKIIEELPKYHIGGIAGGNATTKDNEVLSVLEEGEMILTDKMKKAAYRLIDFKDYLEKKLGHAIGTVMPPIPQVPALAGVGVSERAGIDVGQVNFNPTVQVEINHSGAMTDKDARQFGKTIADTATNELYEGFRRRGIGKLFGTKPTQ